MHNPLEKIKEDYESVIVRIDKVFEELQFEWSDKMICKKGCSTCCITLNLHPVEIFCIKEKMKKESFFLPYAKGDLTEKCIFLKENSCLIYAYRPFICRSQGLPLLVLNEDLYNPEYEVGFCELNFADYSNVEFNSENVLNLEEWNLDLFELNKRYLKLSEENKINIDQRVSMEELLVTCLKK